MGIVLTPEQRQAVAEAGREPPTVIDPETNAAYVLLRREVYERLRRLLDEDTVYTTAEMLDRAMAEDDAKDPFLAELQRKYGGVP
jgi:hypothetical protein